MANDTPSLVKPAPKPGGIDFSNWTYNALPERTGNVGWQPDLQDLIYTAINHVEGDYEDADENCAEQVIERLVLAIKTILAEKDAAEANLSIAVGALEAQAKFVEDFFAPWGSWKTAWWEGEVSDDAAFTENNALKALANKARQALSTITQRDAGNG